MKNSAAGRYRTESITNTVKLVSVIVMLISLVLAPLQIMAQQSIDLSLQPTPTLTPQDVVEFQLDALQQATDDGISATFRFASPANRKMTGPLSRFSRLFDAPQYQPMLNNRGTEIRLLHNDGSNAELVAGVVDNTGELHWYRFQLSKQSETPYENCWMTDAVMAVPHPGRSA